VLLNFFIGKLSTDNDQLGCTGVVYLGMLRDEGGVDAGFLQEVPD
jgi:hypothetical protein